MKLSAWRLPTGRPRPLRLMWPHPSVQPRPEHARRHYETRCARRGAVEESEDLLRVSCHEAGVFMVLNGGEASAELIEAHKACLCNEDFKIW